MSTALETAYISARLANADRIHDIRDELFHSLPIGDKYSRQDAHLTIIPSFQVPREEFHHINELLADTDLCGRDVRIDGVGVYPHIRNPRVVLLDAHIDLSDTRAWLLDELQSVGATNVTEPVPPHITLFKCDNGYVLPDMARRHLQNHIQETRDTWTTTIEYVDLVHATHD